ncbi:MAG: ankyrin repeat domain-containing protein [Bacteroidetes bacterium]|nr:ankyrin repeat domain-containing protein [Bacteroidota bacterium]
MVGFLFRRFFPFLVILIIYAPVIAQVQDSIISSQKDINVDELNKKLLDAAYIGNDVSVLKLLEAGADPNTSMWNGITPLMFAADNGFLKTVKILVLNGADVNKKPENQVSALVSAVFNNNMDIAELLIRHEADINDTDSYGVSSLIYAAAYNYYSLCDMLLYYEENIEVQDKKGTNAVMAATVIGNYDIVKLLIDNGAQINKTDNEGNTALMMAAQNGDTSLINLLLNHHAGPDHVNKYGLSALHVAIKNGHLDAVRLLVNYGAEISPKDNTGYTPYALAKKSGNREMKKYLSSLKIKKTFSPTIDRLFLSPCFKLNTGDLYFGSDVGIMDENLETGLQFGFYSRTIPKRVLIKSDENIFYQYWEKRSNLEFGINKYLHLSDLPSGASVDLYLYGKIVYSFGGKYPGSDKKAKSITKIVPGFGICWGHELFRFNVGYEFFNTGIKPINSHWINLGISVNLNLHKKELQDKVLEWY